MSIDDAAFTAEVVSYLTRLAHADGKADGLTSAQRTALRYFARANPLSRTVSAFADFHATTRGTASQTVKSLVEKGYLTRTPSPVDGRSARVDVTQAGETVVEDDPFECLVQAIADLPATQRAIFAVALDSVARRVADARDARSLGTCGACQHFESRFDEGDCKNSYICALTGESMSRSQLDGLCMNFACEID